MLMIREMVEKDCAVIARSFAAQGWEKPEGQFRRYWKEQLGHQRIVLVAIFDGAFAGYLTIVWMSDYPPFREFNIPEIVDLNVLIKFCRMGIANRLMEEAEKRIVEKAPKAGLGVCLHSDYGPAQALYARRGYIPDGRGVYYRGHHLQYGEQVVLDDDLCLYLIKPLENC